MSDIKVDTNKLRYYAQRLNNVNYRLRNIDADLDRLYLKIDIKDIVKLLKADLSIGYNDKLRKCRDYLNLTADDFEMVEKTLTSRNITVRKPSYTRSTVFSLLRHLFMSVNTSVTKVGRAKKANITDVAGLLSFSAVYETRIKYNKSIIKLIKACMDTIRSVIFDKETIENNESPIKEEIIENEGLHVSEKAGDVNVVEEIDTDESQNDESKTEETAKCKNSSEFDTQVGNGKSLPYKDLGYNVGQCSGYAVSRFSYLYPDVEVETGNANNLLKNNRNNVTVSVIDGGWENISKLKIPCIAVTKGAPYEGVLYGHAIVIEDVTYNEDGSIKDIYFSNSNAYDYNTKIYSNDGKFTDGIDGTVQKLSYEKFTSQDTKEIYGFIIAKE